MEAYVAQKVSIAYVADFGPTMMRSFARLWGRVWLEYVAEGCSSILNKWGV